MIAGDGHDGVGGGQAGGEGIQAWFVVEDIDRWHGHARGDGHLLDHVEQASFLQISGSGVDRPAADHCGHGASPAVELGCFEKGGSANEEDRAARDPDK